MIITPAYPSIRTVQHFLRCYFYNVHEKKYFDNLSINIYLEWETTTLYKYIAYALSV
jgi:hypothetical protein